MPRFIPRTLFGELLRTTIEENNWVERLMNSTLQCWTQTDFGIIKPILVSKNRIICGDINAKNTLWGAVKNDHRGKQLGEAVDELDLTVLNTGRGTRLNTDGSYIHLDVTLASSNLSLKCDWRIIDDDEWGSDHLTTLVTSQWTTEYGGDPLSQVIHSSTSSGSQSKDPLTKKASRERLQCCSTVSRLLLDECFDGQGNLIDNPGTSVTTFNLLKSATEHVSKRIEHTRWPTGAKPGGASFNSTEQTR